MADGLNNTTDIVASVAVLIGLRFSRKPPDLNHKYGHFRAETIATLIASLIMVAVGLQVLITAIHTFFNPTIHSPDPIAAWTAIFCGLVMYLVYFYNLRLAKETNSSAVMAAAQDNKSDAFVSFGAFAGIMGSQIGLSWLDPLVFAVKTSLAHEGFLFGDNLLRHSSGNAGHYQLLRTLLQMAPWVTGWSGSPLTSAIRSPSNLTLRLHVSGQSKGQTDRANFTDVCCNSLTPIY